MIERHSKFPIQLNYKKRSTRNPQNYCVNDEEKIAIVHITTQTVHYQTHEKRTQDVCPSGN